MEPPVKRPMGSAAWALLFLLVGGVLSVLPTAAYRLFLIADVPWWLVTASVLGSLVVLVSLVWLLVIGLLRLTMRLTRRRSRLGNTVQTEDPRV